MGHPEHTIVSVPPLAVQLESVRSAVLAGERRIPMSEPLADVIPGGGLIRGTVVAVDGQAGAGASTLALWLLAGATSAGEWAGVVDPGVTFGGLAAAEAGVVLERLAVVRGVAPRLWSRAVATLLEGMGLVAAVAPPVLSASDARRLVARARERSTVLVVSGRWPGEATVRLTAEESRWGGIGSGEGSLGGGGLAPVPGVRQLRLTVSGRGAAGRSRTVEVAWPPEPGVPSRPSTVEVPGPGIPAAPPEQVAS